MCRLRRLASSPRTAKTGVVTRTAAQLADLVFAHQFGWDEILMFIAPVVLALLGLRWFEKRSERTGPDGSDEGEED